jgi:AhpD family alkylhydroperoxidase
MGIRQSNQQTEDVMKESILNEKTRILIAVGASIAANCHPCLKHHTDRAFENGLHDHEVYEAIEVGRAVKKGAAGSIDKLVAEMKLNVLDQCTISGAAKSCCG